MACDDLITNQDLENAKKDATTMSDFVESDSPEIQSKNGKDIRTLQGINDAADNLISSLGGTDIGDYEDDLTLNSYNEYVVFDRAGATTGPSLWKAIPPRTPTPGTPLPYTIDSTANPDPTSDSNIEPFSDINKAGAEQIADDFDNNRQKETTGLSDVTEVSSGDDIFPLIGQGIRVNGVGLWVVPSVTTDGSPMPNPALLDSLPTSENVTVNGGTPVTLRFAIEYTYPTLDVALSRHKPINGNYVYVQERFEGLGGGSWWEYVLTSDVTPNGFEIVQCANVPIYSMRLVVNNKAVAEAFGAKGDLSEDDSPALRNMAEYCAVNGIKNIEMKRNYLIVTDIAVSPAGFGVIFDERHNNSVIDCEGGTLVNGNTTSGTWSLLALDTINGDIDNIKIKSPKFIADAVMTADDAQDNIDNDASGNFVNGITARAVPPYRNRNCALTGVVSGFKLGNNTVNTDCVENFNIDTIYSEECALHPIGARAVSYGAINTWPSDLQPSIDIKTIQGYNTRTLFDFTTVGDSKPDTGPNFATAHVHSVIGHNITGRTKVHGYWAFKMGSCSIKNDSWDINPNGSPGVDFTNPNYVDITCDAIRVENFSRAVRFENSNVQATIDTLESINCLFGIQNYGSDVLVNRYITLGTFGLYVNQSNPDYNFACNSFIIENVRRQKYVDWLAANPTLWTGITVPAYPIIFGSLNGKMRWSNGVFRDCGEDVAPVYSIFAWAPNSNASQTASITMFNVDYEDPSPVPLNNIFQADGYQTVHFNNVNEKEAVATNRFYRDNFGNSRLYMSNCENTTPITEKFGGTLSKQGSYWTWVSSTDVLRISGTLPTDRDTSGVPVGSQS